MKTTCYACQSGVTDKDNFCASCGEKLKCPKCSHRFVEKVKFCSSCGTSVANTNAAIAAPNSIRYRETVDERVFDASFSNEIGDKVARTFDDVIKSRNGLPQGGLNTREQLPSATNDSAAHSMNGHSSAPPPIVAATGNSLSVLRTIFSRNERGVIIQEPRLKATGKLDYAARIAYLFVLYCELDQQQPAQRSELMSLLKEATVYDSNYRKFIGRKKSDFDLKRSTMAFKNPGREKAIGMLQELNESGREDAWLPGHGKSSSKKKRTPDDPLEAEEVGKKAKSKPKSGAPRIEPQPFKVDASPKLAALIEEKKPKNTGEKILVIAYYICNVLKANVFTDGNIDFAYRAVGLTNRPNHLHQMIQNQKTNHEWFEHAGGSGDRWKLSRIGEIHVEEKMPKK